MTGTLCEALDADGLPWQVERLGVLRVLRVLCVDRQ